ncbi:hypothetical protein BBK82_03110 [Lentzea guizhouensis]|uniref:Nudix hydrolase domain-containing protein n=1 Tax=Lentzea guizhouensis TaxID=1586287 RepID=A0A1B2HXP5_9PSEU|nr:hypothetical protein BBK82_03110 [Lentzea guizhouensis]
MSLVADLAVFAPVDDELCVLLVKRKYRPYKGWWALPGGEAEANERSRDAAVRELKEETGVHLTEVRRVDAFDEPERDPRGRFVSIAYTARLNDAPKPTAGDDAAEARWRPVSSLLHDDVAFDHRQIIGAALQVWGLDWEHVGTSTSARK